MTDTQQTLSSQQQLEELTRKFIKSVTELARAYHKGAASHDCNLRFETSVTIPFPPNWKYHNGELTINVKTKLV